VRKHLVSYATKSFRNSQKTLAHSAVDFDLDVIWSYTREQLVTTDFYKQHRKILDAQRGAGYWLWKPFWLNATIDVLDEDDLLVYSDAGIRIICNLTPLFDLCIQKGGILLFHAHYDDIGVPGPCINRRWTKRDCFRIMDCDTPEYWDARHIDASFQVYQKNPETRRFLGEYLSWCLDVRVLTDCPNSPGVDNLPEFVQHREDQSVLSLLAIKHGVEIFRHPSQYGNHLKLPLYRIPGETLAKPYSSKPYKNSPYHTLLNHHRSKG